MRATTFKIMRLFLPLSWCNVIICLSKINTRKMQFPDLLFIFLDLCKLYCRLKLICVNPLKNETNELLILVKSKSTIYFIVLNYFKNKCFTSQRYILAANGVAKISKFRGSSCIVEHKAAKRQLELQFCFYY